MDCEVAVPFSPQPPSLVSVTERKTAELRLIEAGRLSMMKKTAKEVRGKLPKPDTFDPLTVLEVTGVVVGPVQLTGARKKEKRFTLDCPEGRLQCRIDPDCIDLFLCERDRLMAFIQKGETSDSLWTVLAMNDPGAAEMGLALPPPWISLSYEREDIVALLRQYGKISEHYAERVLATVVATERNPQAQYDPARLMDALNKEAVRCQQAVAAQHWEGLNQLVHTYAFLGRESMERLLRQWYVNCTLRRFYLLGLTRTVLRKCAKYSNDLDTVYDVLTTNPYKLLQLPIERADWIMALTRTPIDPIHRRVGEIAREIARTMEERGNSYLTPGEAYALFGEEFFKVATLLPDYKIHYDKDKRVFYTDYSVQCEKDVAGFVKRLQKQTLPIEVAEGDLPDHLDDSQREALSAVLREPVSVITGRGGSGKTTLIKSLVHIAEGRHMPYLLCSFTGMAVSNIKKAARRPAFTIHSLLTRGAEGADTVRTKGTARTTAAFSDPLNEKAVVDKSKQGAPHQGIMLIVDEISMVATYLLHQLVLKLPRISNLVLVGDVEQLMPIEWGAFMREIMRCKAVPTHRLTNNHRIKGSNDVASLQANIERLNSGVKGFHFIPSPTFQVINGEMEAVGDVLDRLLEEGVPIKDIALITPYVALIEGLNEAVRSRWFPDSLEQDQGPWYVGARVMQTENNNLIGIMNGMEGVIIDRETDPETQEERVVVEFEMYLEGDPGVQRRDDGSLFVHHTYVVGQNPAKTETEGVSLEWEAGKTVKEEKKDKGKKGDDTPPPLLYTSELAVSFGATIHKKQGSEDPIIIFYCPRHGANSSFLCRELINVAITRAKKRVTIVGDIRAIELAVDRPTPRRHAFLAERIDSEAEA